MAVIQDTLRLNDEYSRVLRDYINNLTRAGSAARSGSDSNRLYGDSAANAARQTSGLVSELRGLAGAYLGIQGVRALTGLSDSMTSITARLDMMNDGLQTTEELNRMIYESAQRSRGSYQQTANLVAKLGTLAGDAFSSNREIIAFAEQLNKQMALSGTTTQEAQAAMLQLTQGLASGTLRGEELNSVLEQTPMIAQSIAKYMGVNTGEMRELASEGAITAGVVKSAMFAMADEINAKFEQMPMTWGQVWTLMGNVALQALNPVLTGVNWIANNIDIIGPLVLGVAGAFAVYAAATQGVALATKVWTAAQAAFNAVMALNPVFLIIMGVVLLIAAIYAVVAAVNKATGSTVSATGIIMGAFAVAGAFILNTVLGVVNFVIGLGVELYNLIATFANFFANVFNDPVGAIINLFAGMFDFILGIVQSAASLIDTVLGTDMSGAVSNFRGTVATKVEEIVGDQVEVMQKLSASDYQIQRIEYGDAWAAGNDFGAGLEDKISGAFNLGGGVDYGLENINTGFNLDDITANTGQTAANTGAAADALSTSTEELAYLRDIAEREAVNRFTTAEVRVEQSISNNINNSADLDGVISALTDGFTEALMTAAEGVHA